MTTQISKTYLKTLKKLITNREFRAKSNELVIPINYFKSHLTPSSIVIPENTKFNQIENEKFNDIKIYSLSEKAISELPAEYRNTALVTIKLPNNEEENSKQIVSEKDKRILILDKLSDPSNLGKLLHAASLLNWDRVLILRGSCSPLNLAVIKSSFGTSLNFNYWSMIDYEELDEIVNAKGFELVLADMPPKEISLDNINKPVLFDRVNKSLINNIDIKFDKLALVLGSEHHGISQNINSTIGIGIPIDNKLNSLNVASAGAILMDYLNSV
ncbi:alpha/beta knot [Conidiobolus coronatus NRRL 28638]|uniref:Alpha/beta knot n=1 Tax=Conidiobolus coronatus (strain ATCC 28846 / CBS 209.66 / NRRL 28638) TaxID=796925 RepID=A0A137PDA2_CONC2|nr:alpha/beta knot [Conidiobolus coronatus NRRL 28638]|eukprot:KXN72977.1 alpha/beta knot [Conidiobolus coronatus NRRL 28638]